MSILNHLEFQTIDDDFSDSVPKEHQHDADDEIELRDNMDESELNHYLDEVVEDIHHDPNWFSFTDDDPKD